MNLKMKITVIVLLMILIPLGVYSAVTENTTSNDTNSSIIGSNISIMDNNNLSQNNTKLLDVPDVRQPSDYSSGATSLQAVLSYYGMDINADELINMTNTTPENATSPENLADAARKMGFNAEIKQNMTLKDLQGYLNQGTPIIVDVQAWKSNTTNVQNWTDDIVDGHYMVVIGIDDENVYLEDPAVLGSRGYISNQEFLERWHDQYQNIGTQENITTTHLGLIITGKESPVRPLIIKID